MGTYIEIGGLKTWYDEDGSGEPLMLLHGGLSPNETWGPQMPEFGKQFRVLAPERRGHGHTPDVDGPFSYDDMATDTIAFLEAVVDGPAHWPVVFAKSIEMASREPRIPPSELKRIAAPTLVVAGDDDIVSFDHTIELFGSIPNAELAIVPGTSHFLTMKKPDVVNRLTMDFIQNDPSPTMMPIRRADPSAHAG